MVHRVAESDGPGFAGRFTTGIRWILLLVVPASVLLSILAHPLIVTVLEHGNFSSEASLNTARALTGLAVGLAGFSVYLFSLRAFYAHEDTRTPFFLNLFQNAVNIVLAVALFDRHGVLGLGLAFALSYLVAAMVTLGVLQVRHRALDTDGFPSLVRPIVPATVALALVTWQLHARLDPNGTFGHLTEVLLAGSAGAMTYAIITGFGGVYDVDRILAGLRRIRYPRR
jgi:putative peptidoglycan lipid II flippase